ncbi:hypothetical protein ACLB2K_068638 [Fragaria x ananassa]
MFIPNRYQKFELKPKLTRLKPRMGAGHDLPLMRLIPLTSTDAHGWCTVRHMFMPWRALWRTISGPRSHGRSRASTRLSSSNNNKDPKPSQQDLINDASSLVSSASDDKLSEDALNQVDQFLREALQNPRERLSIFRMEQDFEKFIRDPIQQQLEFQQLPTSYLRLAAHRVAQHYALQSMVLLDNNLPDGAGSRIIVRKTPECRLPLIRLADITVSLLSEESGVTKVAIKQRPQKRSQMANSGGSNSSKGNSSKSVEERKEDSRSFSRRRTEKEPVGRYKPNNRVAIFRVREIDRKDPDYDRSYDRYMQRFDPGFGFSGGPYTIQPMYTPALNYNTEFPQLGSTHGPQISTEHQPRPLPQHLPGPWVAPSPPGGIGYGHPETIMTPFNPNHVAVRSTSGIYLPSSQYPCQRPGMPFMHPHEHVHQHFSQSHQQQPDASFGLARPRSAGMENQGGLEMDQFKGHPQYPFPLILGFIGSFIHL